MHSQFYLPRRRPTFALRCVLLALSYWSCPARARSEIDFSAIEDSYTSLFAPCDFTFYREGKGSAVEQGTTAENSNLRRASKAHDDYSCESLDPTDKIDSKSVMVVFWPDASVGSGSRCYLTQDIATLESDALARWQDFAGSIESLVNDTGTNVDVDLTASISQNVTERIRAEFSIVPSEATHIMVNCNADKRLAKEIESNAEMAIYVGGAAVLAMLVCFCACIVTCIWCCCCRDSASMQKGEYAPVPAVRVETGLLSPAETGLEVPLGPNVTPSAPKYEGNVNYGSTV